MFIERDFELKELERLYAKDNFQCVIIYGRRRIGKTSLITEFIKDKKAIYFTGQETNSKENLAFLSQSIFSLTNDFSNVSSTFLSYKDAIEAVFNIATNQRIILAIDEYPYLAASYKSISSLIQTCIDKYKETSKLYIILCGSSLSFMENQVLGYKSPLFGRRTAQLKINPFEFSQTKKYFSNNIYGKFDIAILYGITGGIPMYMSLIDMNLSVRDNIKQYFLTPTGYMYEEPGNLIKQECREPAQYNAIIKAIANGASRLSEISSKVGLETAQCSIYITRLISIGIVKKEYPFRQETSKKTIYVLEDSMFKFWYRFIPNNISLIQRGETDIAYSMFSDQISSYMGSVFEEICKQYLWKLNIEKKIPFIFTDAGRWWGNNPNKREECEIDILADNKENAIFAECKWTNDDVNISVLNTLIERSELFNYDMKYYYIFSKTGFTQSLRDKSEKLGNVSLVDFEEIFSNI